jgi:hypothetical protein
MREGAAGLCRAFQRQGALLTVILCSRISGLASSLPAANAVRSMLGSGVMLLGSTSRRPALGSATTLAIALLVSADWSVARLLPRRRHALG